MKKGTITRYLTKPKEGFSFCIDGYKIAINYIEPDSIKEIVSQDDSNEIEYECSVYTYFGTIKTYEELVSKCVLLKYTIENEIGLTSKKLAGEDTDEYKKYREYVNVCKSAAKENYENLGLYISEE